MSIETLAKIWERGPVIRLPSPYHLHRTMTLEVRSIQTIRADLIVCDAPRVLDIWNEAYTIKGCSAEMYFSTSIRRDVIAYLLIRVVLDLFSGRVFGGFLQAHHTGLRWSDVDLATSSTMMSSDSIMDVAVKFMRFTLGLDAFSITVVKTQAPAYGGTSYDVKVDDFVVPVDIVTGSSLDRKTSFPPCTLGSCLEMSADRDVRIRRKVGWFPGVNECDIIALLRNQCDVQVCDATNRSSTTYRRYFWKRIDKMCARGLTMLDKTMGGPPPEKLA